ncbi:MAG: hypothetical protein P8177_14705 [Gemmatimonadota bacterium]
MRIGPASAVLALALGATAPVAAQAPLEAAPLGTAPGAPAVLRSPAGASLASMVLPGAGQAALGKRRWVLYALLEVGLWAVRLDATGDRRTATDGYRDLAWTVARGPYQTLPRRDGAWGYYETMSHYIASGAYDRTPDPGVQPETDERTYNGTVWSLARSLYLPGGEGEPGSPGYAEALAYYADHAAGPAYLWSWAAQPDALDRFRSLIDDADDAARTARAALGAVLANHFVSAVDALVTARGIAGGGFHLESRVTADPLPTWELGIRLALPRANR